MDGGVTSEQLVGTKVEPQTPAGREARAAMDEQPTVTVTEHASSLLGIRLNYDSDTDSEDSMPVTTCTAPINGKNECAMNDVAHDASDKMSLVMSSDNEPSSFKGDILQDSTGSQSLGKSAQSHMVYPLMQMDDSGDTNQSQANDTNQASHRQTEDTTTALIAATESSAGIPYSDEGGQQREDIQTEDQSTEDYLTPSVVAAVREGSDGQGHSSEPLDGQNQTSPHDRNRHDKEYTVCNDSTTYQTESPAEEDQTQLYYEQQERTYNEDSCVGTEGGSTTSDLYSSDQQDMSLVVPYPHDGCGQGKDSGLHSSEGYSLTQGNTQEASSYQLQNYSTDSKANENCSNIQLLSSGRQQSEGHPQDTTFLEEGCSGSQQYSEPPGEYQEECSQQTVYRDISNDAKTHSPVEYSNEQSFSTGNQQYTEPQQLQQPESDSATTHQYGVNQGRHEDVSSPQHVYSANQVEQSHGGYSSPKRDQQSKVQSHDTYSHQHGDQTQSNAAHVQSDAASQLAQAAQAHDSYSQQQSEQEQSNDSYSQQHSTQVYDGYAYQQSSEEQSHRAYSQQQSDNVQSHGTYLNQQSYSSHQSAGQQYSDTAAHQYPYYTSDSTTGLQGQGQDYSDVSRGSGSSQEYINTQAHPEEQYSYQHSGTTSSYQSSEQPQGIYTQQQGYIGEHSHGPEQSQETYSQQYSQEVDSGTKYAQEAYSYQPTYDQQYSQQSQAEGHYQQYYDDGSHQYGQTQAQPQESYRYQQGHGGDSSTSQWYSGSQGEHQPTYPYQQSYPHATPQSSDYYYGKAQDQPTYTESGTSANYGYYSQDHAQQDYYNQQYQSQPDSHNWGRDSTNSGGQSYHTDSQHGSYGHPTHQDKSDPSSGGYQFAYYKTGEPQPLITQSRTAQHQPEGQQYSEEYAEPQPRSQPHHQYQSSTERGYEYQDHRHYASYREIPSSKQQIDYSGSRPSVPRSPGYLNSPSQSPTLGRASASTSGSSSPSTGNYSPNYGSPRRSYQSSTSWNFKHQEERHAIVQPLQRDFPRTGAVMSQHSRDPEQSSAQPKSSTGGEKHYTNRSKYSGISSGFLRRRTAMLKQSNWKQKHSEGFKGPQLIQPHHEETSESSAKVGMSAAKKKPKPEKVASDTTKGPPHKSLTGFKIPKLKSASSKEQPPKSTITTKPALSKVNKVASNENKSSTLVKSKQASEEPTTGKASQEGAQTAPATSATKTADAKSGNVTDNKSLLSYLDPSTLQALTSTIKQTLASAPKPPLTSSKAKPVVVPTHPVSKPTIPKKLVVSAPTPMGSTADTVSAEKGEIKQKPSSKSSTTTVPVSTTTGTATGQTTLEKGVGTDTMKQDLDKMKRPKSAARSKATSAILSRVTSEAARSVIAQILAGYNTTQSKSASQKEADPKDSTTRQEPSAMQDSSTRQDTSTRKDSSTRQDTSTRKDSSTRQDSSTGQDSSTRQAPSTKQSPSTRQDSSAGQDSTAGQDSSTRQTSSTKQDSSNGQYSSTRQDTSTRQDSSARQTSSTKQDSSNGQYSSTRQDTSTRQDSSAGQDPPTKNDIVVIPTQINTKHASSCIDSLQDTQCLKVTANAQPTSNETAEVRTVPHPSSALEMESNRSLPPDEQDSKDGSFDFFDPRYMLKEYNLRRSRKSSPALECDTEHPLKKQKIESKVQSPTSSSTSGYPLKKSGKRERSPGIDSDPVSMIEHPAAKRSKIPVKSTTSQSNNESIVLASINAQGEHKRQESHDNPSAQKQGKKSLANIVTGLSRQVDKKLQSSQSLEAIGPDDDETFNEAEPKQEKEAEAAKRKPKGSQRRKSSPTKRSKKRHQQSDTSHHHDTMTLKREICSLCSLRANVSNLGFLFGPYTFVHNPHPSTDENSRDTASTLIDEEKELTRMFEVWIHEDCAVWAPGVCLVGNKLMGLQEAVSDANSMICTTCTKSGATLCCKARGCKTVYHYPCANESGCEFIEEQFLIHCPNHKEGRR